MYLRLPLLATSICLSASLAHAADWPQWRGPDRTEISKETGINTNWTAKKPKLLWTYDKAGNGYSGPAIVGNVLYCLGGEDGKEFAFALDTATGQEKWRTSLGNFFKNGYGGGPRCTPTVHGDVLYVIRGDGDLHCLETATGAEKWHKSLKRDFGGSVPGWGFSESPLVDGEKLVCTPGGSRGAITALNKDTGDVIWSCKELKDPACYSSIVAAEVAGVRQYVQMTAKGLAGVRASDGELLWYYERPGQRVAPIPTPIVHEDLVYATAGYNCGCDLVKLTRDGDKFKAEKVYANKNMVNKHGGVVLLNGFVYGSTENKGWVCQDFKTGDNKWEERGKGRPGMGSLTCAAGHIFCYDERSGMLYCVEASPKGWKDKGSFTIPQKSEIRSGQGGIWTHPVIANGKLYLRDQDLLFCFDLKQ